MVGDTGSRYLVAVIYNWMVGSGWFVVSNW